MFLEDKKFGETPTITAVSLLLAAAEYMDKHGWCQGSPSDSEGRVCLSNSINHVARHDSNKGFSESYDLLRHYLGVQSVAIWNDEVCQSQAQAIAALIGAANTKGGITGA